MPPVSKNAEMIPFDQVRQQVQGVLSQSQNRALQDLAVTVEQGIVVLDGKLPSYYLKQIAQTLVASVAGVCQIENRIDVVRNPSVGSTADLRLAARQIA